MANCTIVLLQGNGAPPYFPLLDSRYDEKHRAHLLVNANEVILNFENFNHGTHIFPLWHSFLMAISLISGPAPRSVLVRTALCLGTSGTPPLYGPRVFYRWPGWSTWACRPWTMQLSLPWLTAGDRRRTLSTCPAVRSPSRLTMLL